MHDGEVDADAVISTKIGRYINWGQTAERHLVSDQYPQEGGAFAGGSGSSYGGGHENDQARKLLVGELVQGEGATDLRSLPSFSSFKMELWP